MTRTATPAAPSRATGETDEDRRVTLIDVAPRDGLQNEATPFSTEDKLRLIQRLQQAGLRRIEVCSFAHPKRVPQMADAEALCARLPRAAGLRFAGLVLNERGFDRARATGALHEVGLVVCVTDAFSQRNQGFDLADSLALARTLTARAKADGFAVSVSLSVAFGCPYAGEVDSDHVAALAGALAEAAPDEIVLSDTIGVAVPDQVARTVHAVRAALQAAVAPSQASDIALRAHFHDTRNTAVANTMAALQAGVRRFDASLGGLGGCPFAPAAGGNVATEDLAYCLQRSGWLCGVDLERLNASADWLAQRIGRPLPGRVSRAGPFPETRALS